MRQHTSQVPRARVHVTKLSVLFYPQPSVDSPISRHVVGDLNDLIRPMLLLILARVRVPCYFDRRYQVSIWRVAVVFPIMAKAELAALTADSQRHG